ncbi:IclR family transcriptional regulator [Paracoccus beibuensis]|uniref:IclR family transcriptional regulator n=1 Tax=Paracoccus beibuensis TaxID=547602 RepID=UPI0022408308|nr:helix-turn-helix domain-containing protein [Paracoccus beibuensis]
MSRYSLLQTLDRGIETLLLVARSPGDLRVSDVARQLDLTRAVAYRIVATLCHHKMIRRREDGRLTLGGAAFQLGAAATDTVRKAARAVLEQLAEETEATAFLSVAEGSECVVAMTAEPRNAVVAIHYRVGVRHPLNRGAAGLAILAGRPPSSDEPEEVSVARRSGFALTRGQLHRGAVGVSSPLILPPGLDQLNYSIGVVALEALDTDMACCAVCKAAQRLSAILS